MSHKNIAGGLGTSFGPGTTKQGPTIPAGQVPPPMSAAGEKLAAVTAPSDAYEVRTSSTGAVKNQ